MAEKNKNPDPSSLEGTSQVVSPVSKDPASNNSDISKQETVPETETLTDTSDTLSNLENQPSRSRPFLRRIKGFMNLYFVVFFLLILLVAVGIYAGIKLTDKTDDVKTDDVKTLTDKEIADLKGNTTIVGDAQQVLDIQGNAVFEGQVLMRKNLDVAGSIKVGGTLSLPAITVGGTSNFGQIQVNQTLSVNGNTTLQGRLNVQRGLAVAGASTFSGALSAGQINVTTLQLTGDLVISKHIRTTGGAPSRTSGSALGNGGTVSVSGTDTAGTVTINTGGSPSSGCFVTINFTQDFTDTPHAVISPSNSRAGTLQFYANRSSGSLSICTVNNPSSGQTYIYDYIVLN